VGEEVVPGKPHGLGQDLGQVAILGPDIVTIRRGARRQCVAGRQDQGFPTLGLSILDEHDLGPPAAPVRPLDHLALQPFNVQFQEVDRAAHVPEADLGQCGHRHFVRAQN
jgi:hypothetical protein